MVAAALDLLQYALLGLALSLPGFTGLEFWPLTLTVLLIPAPFFLIGIKRSGIAAFAAAALMLAAQGGYAVLILKTEYNATAAIMSISGMLALTGAGMAALVGSGRNPDAALSWSGIGVMGLALLAAAAAHPMMGSRSPQAVMTRGLVELGDQGFENQRQMLVETAAARAEREPTRLEQFLGAEPKRPNPEALERQIEHLAAFGYYVTDRASGLLFALLGCLLAVGGFVSVKLSVLLLARSGDAPPDFAPMTEWRTLRLWTWLLAAGLLLLHAGAGPWALTLQRAGLSLVILALGAALVGGTALFMYMTQQYFETMSAAGALLGLMVMMIAAFLFYQFMIMLFVIAGLLDSWVGFRRFAPREKDAAAANFSDPNRDQGSENQGGPES